MPCSLSNNQLGAKGAAAIAPALAANGVLKSINLSGNSLTSRYSRDMTGITELAAALTVNGALTQVLAFCLRRGALFSSLALAFALNGIAAGPLKQRAVRRLD